MDTEKAIKKSGADYLKYSSGCLDFVVSSDRVVFIKSFSNADSIRKGQARRMRDIMSLSESLSIISASRMGRKVLEDGVVYERYSIAVVSPPTLRNILEGDFPLKKRDRGGLYKMIDPDKLRRKRIESGLTQEELAKMVGATKKTIYIHEKKEMPAPAPIVDAIEQILGSITKPFSIEPDEPEKRESRVDAGLFDIVRREDETVFVKERPKSDEIKYVEKFHEITGMKTIVVSPWKIDTKLDVVSP